MQCFVYRSTARLGTYLFVPRADDFGDVPPDLLARLGPLELAMELELAPERRLARTTGDVVMGHLQQAGFYLQLPPDWSAG